MFEGRMLYLRWIIVLALLSFACTVFMQPGVAAQTSVHNAESQQYSSTSSVITKEWNRRHLLLIVVPGFSFEHLPQWIDAFPISMQQELHLAGMSMRTEGGYQLEHNLMTMATGHRTTSIKGWNAYQAEELLEGVAVKDWLLQRSGKMYEGPILHPEIHALQKKWVNKQTAPGWLGQLLQEQQIVTNVYGNSDLPHQKRRLAATFIMDGAGQAAGNIGEEMMIDDPSFPTGQRIDLASIRDNVAQIWQGDSSSLTVVELGDMERLHYEKEQMDASYYETVYQRWYGQLGEWMLALEEEALALSDEGQVSIWIMSAMVEEQAKRAGKLLAPVMLWQPSSSVALLTSETTRQEGIVANLDIVPSILGFFGLEQPLELVGRQMRSLYQEPSLIRATDEGVIMEGWLDQTAYLFSIYQERRTVITTYISVAIVILIASALIYWFYYRPRSAQLVQIGMGMIMISPVYLLWLTPMIQFISTPAWLLLLFVASLASSYLLCMFFSTIATCITITSLHIGVIIYDLGQGSLWMKRSFLGFDALIGARFYGLGNEYAGILLGSTILCLTAIYVWLVQRYQDSAKFSRYRRIYLALTGVLYLLILYFVAAPGLGTNAGATLAKAVTFFSSYFLLFKIPLAGASWLLLIVAGLLLTGGIIFLHMRGGEATHIGSFLQLIQAGQLDSVQEIMLRKWQMNLKLIKVSLWGKLFATTLIVLLVLLFHKKRQTDEQVLGSIWFNGFKTIILGAVLLLLMNDSGIVAAATSMIFVTCPFVMLRFEAFPPTPSLEEGRNKRL